MTPDNIPPSLERFGTYLNRAAHQQLADARPARSRVRRPRLLAGGTLTLAGVATALVLVLGAAGSSPSKAYAITTNSDGTVLVHLQNLEAIPAAQAQLASMGRNEWFEAAIIPGPASTDGPIDCTVPTAAQVAQERDAVHAAVPASPGGPPVKVLLGSDGTSSVPAGDTGAGPWHLANCYLYAGSFPGVGNTGGTGSGNSGS